MAKKPFFYDDCRSGNRLAREYDQSAPACWSQEYNSPYQAYRYTVAGGVNYITLMSEPPRTNFEVNVTMKTNNADAMMGVILRRTRSTVTPTPGSFFVWCTGGIFGLVFVDATGATPVLSSVAYVVDPTKYHHIRAQVEGRLVKAKIWVDGTAEPDWMIAYRIRYKEFMLNGVIGFEGTVRTVYYTNIRWTPIPRTGGP